MPVPTAVTIGNFDGVHLGHQALIAAARQAAGPAGRVTVLAFDPHPLTVLRPGATVPRLTAFDHRTELCRAAGADVVERLEPTRDLLGQSPQAFIERLCDRYEVRAMVEGPDFRFGRGRAGTVDTLRDLAGQFGFEACVIAPVEAALTDQSLVRVSSTMVRRLIGLGRVRDAARLLGRPYELRGNVERGEQRGRDLGVPTANLDAGDLLLPADGIYAGRGVLPDGSAWPAAVSIGTKPTFGRHRRLCEAHLIGFNGQTDHYGWPMRLQFHEWLRDQVAFESVEALSDQLQRDLNRTAMLAGTAPGAIGV